MSSDINNPKTYWNGRLAGRPNMLYNKFVNYDIVWPTYSHFWQRKKPTSFYLEKRKWYKFEDTTTNFEWWEVTDVIKLDESSCSENKCYEFFFLVRWWDMKILGKECWTCWDYFFVYEWCRCECQYDRFLTTDFVRWIPRKIANTWLSNNRVSTTWIQRNIWTTVVQWQFSDSLTFNTSPTSNWVQIGDYVYVWWSPNGTWDAVCWQVRQILDMPWDISSPSDWYSDFLMSTPWTWFPPSTTTLNDATYSIFPEWGKVIMFATCEWIKIMHSVNNRYDLVDWVQTPAGSPFLTTVCDYVFGLNGTIQCISWMQEFWNRINVMFDNWYNMFWWLSFDKMYMSLDSYNFVWPDKIASVTFRNFLVSFGKSTIYTLVYNITTWLSNWYELRDNLWIFSKYAYTQFDNWFFFLASDRRLYALSIVPDWETYVLDLKDMSDIVKWDLDMIQDTDEVFLHADGANLYIFINWRNNQDNTDTTKTKILKFSRDYWVWVEHQVSLPITGKRLNYFIWKWLFSYCWDKDAGSTLYVPWQEDGWTYFDAYIDAFIWEQEENGTELNQFTRKKANWLKVILGRGIYTNNNTNIVIDQYVWWYKAQYAVSNVESIEWIRNNNAIISWTESSIEPNVCVTDNLNDYSTITRVCNGSFDTIQDSSPLDCQCAPDIIKKDDYLICVDDKAYALSETYTLRIPLHDAIMESDMFRVRLYSKNWDRMVFGWMIMELEQQPIEQWDADWMDVLVNDWCCSIEYCE